MRLGLKQKLMEDGRVGRVYRKNINQGYREGGGDEPCTQHCQA